MSGTAPQGSIRPPSKLRRPTTLTSGPGPGSSSARPSPLGSGGSGVRTPLSAASSLSALNDRSETGGPFNSGLVDDFIIGDRVWVNGTKPGYIQFLGETQFSSGDWAGVVLDEPVGKNDGSVNGVRYFQCEPKRGVFARPERLSRFPGPGANGTSTTATLVSPGKTQVTTTRVSSPSGSTRSSPRAVTMHTSSTTTDYGLRVGDRVIVNASSGMKAGTLRFMGPTEFATGQWAGVELDDPVGKNDGSVAGKKYFRCPPRHGLFAPLHKVAREGGHTSTTTMTTTRTTRITSPPRRAGSQDSLHSSLSSASARAGVRLGVAALTSPAKRSSKPLSSSMVASQNSLQVALREKEEHVEQLLKERDLERAEVARAAVQVEEAEQKMAMYLAEHQRYVEDAEQRAASFQQLLEEHEQERAQLTALNADLQRKVEDMQFRLEEQEILHSQDEEGGAKNDSQKISELERQLREYQTRLEAAKLECSQENDANQLALQFKNEAQTLKDALARSEAKVSSLEAKQTQDTSALSKLREELLSRDETLLRLEASLEQRAKEVLSLRDKAFELEESLVSSKETEELHQRTVEDLSARLAKIQADYDFLSEESQIIKSDSADQQRQLTSAEERCQQLQAQKQGLEEELGSLRLTASGGSQQVAQLNAQLGEKERLVENLESQLRALSQECERAKQETVQQMERQQAATERSSSDHTREVAALQQKLVDLEAKCEERLQRCRNLEQTASDLQGELDSRGSALEDKLASSERRIEQLAKELQQAKEEVQEERRQRERDRLDHGAQASERELQLEATRGEVEKLRAQFDSHREDLLKQLREQQEESRAVDEMHNQLESQLGVVNELREVLTKTEEEKQTLMNRISKLEAELAAPAPKVGDADAEEVKALKAKVEELQNREHRLTSAEEELRGELERMRGRAEEGQRKVTQLSQQVSQLEMELDRRSASRDLLESLERDKLRLEAQVRELGTAKASANGKSASTLGADGDHQVIKEERDSLQMQVEFLNSIIVDMQRKNDQLKARIEILEAGPLDDVDINLNGIKGPIAPRLFCDICDRFDVHDTADCPIQCSLEEETVTHSHHGSPRRSTRPYCDVCEVFGHTSAECDPCETY